MPDPFPRGRFCWHELMTSDTTAAAAFYTKLTGWSTQAWPEDPAYTLWMNRGAPVGGLMTLPQEAGQVRTSPHWLPYMAVEDADGSAFRATALGAQVLRDVQQVPTVGRFAVLEDPQGAVFAILQPEGEVPGHDDEPQRGEFSWHELATTDWQAAWSFYQALFGWEQTTSIEMGPAGVYQMYGRAGRTLGGIYTKAADQPASPHWLCYIKVPSADQAAQTVKQLDGQVVNGAMDVPSGDRIAQCIDPQGAIFAVHSAAAKPVARPEPEPAMLRPDAPATTTAATTVAAPRTARKRTTKPKSAKRRPVKKSARKKKR